MELQSAVNLIVLLTVIWIALSIRRRERSKRRPEPEEAAAEAAFLHEPARPAAEESDEPVRPAAVAPARPRASFGDRVFGGVAAGALIAAVVFTLQVYGYGGPLSSLLAMAIAALPGAVQAMDPLFAGAALVGAASFVIGFLFPRLIVRIRPAT